MGASNPDPLTQTSYYIYSHVTPTICWYSGGLVWDCIISSTDTTERSEKYYQESTKILLSLYSTRLYKETQVSSGNPEWMRRG